MSKKLKKDALAYHSSGRKGKLEVIPTKPSSSQKDLSLAYSPGVAEPCLEIAENPDKVYEYTIKGNLVAVISDGSAVLGLGNIGPLASKPVMEGKGLLFKVFADIDVFDIEVDTSNIDDFVKTVKAISPTFGGINLEDIKAPEAFEIEERLKEELDIPIMHDDQHGTAIISLAALQNALLLSEKNIEDVKIVVSGAGAAAMSCIDLYLQKGAQLKNIFMFDSKGLIHDERNDLGKRKKRIANKNIYESMAEAMINADVFLGLSKGDIVSQHMVASMAKDPIVFALANPDPEIGYKAAKSVRDDIIMATGRSDNPNQVNNVLGFPYIFRGALDVRAHSINNEMKLAAAEAIAELTKEPVPAEVSEAYGMGNLTFSRDFIIPKPMDPRLISRVSSAVAKAAMDSGVARVSIDDWDAYEHELNARLGHDNKLIRNVADRASKKAQRVVFAEGENYNVLKAAELAIEEGVAIPILLGNEEKINDVIEAQNLELEGAEIIDPKSKGQEDNRLAFGELLFEKRSRKGLTIHEAHKALRDRNYFGAMLVENGMADAMVSGVSRNYRSVIKPALEVVGTTDGVEKVAGMHIVQTKNGPIFFADTTVNVNPTAREIADLTILVAQTVKRFQVKPRIALLSYSNFGSATGKDASKMAEVAKILHEEQPDLVVDGEIQANMALDKNLRDELFPFSKLSKTKVNTLIFPNLSAGNIAYKLMQESEKNEVVGPILLGMKKSVHVLQLGSSVRDILNMVRIAAVDAQSKR